MRTLSYKQLIAALTAGLALRLFFILKFPFYSGDTKFYEELARNWLDHGVYGLFIQGRLMPVDMRMPGYPAFLAVIYAALGRTRIAIMIAQAMVDLGTCVLAALLAARLASPANRTRAATAGLWLAVLCPFTANYTAAILTETLVTFVATLAIFYLVGAFEDASNPDVLRTADRKSTVRFSGRWIVTGLLTGIATLVRPESPLLAVAAGLAMVMLWRRGRDWRKLGLAGSWMTLGVILALLPWAARNARTLGRVQFLAPRYAESYGDYIPRGFFAWTQTWMVRFGEAYRVTWKLGNAPILMEDFPERAFDSAEERARVESLLQKYNDGWRITPVADHEFAVLANERTEHRPLRTYLFVPGARTFAMWFTPRVELLPYTGHLWPPGERWREDASDFGATAFFGLLNIGYLAAALAGAWRIRKHPGLAFLITFFVIRTAYLTQLQTVEPRYVMVCYPAILALAAQVAARSVTRKQET
ncbi:MAG: hypothetical protein ACRD50_01150 [Candidatus Acidiferrales bacterium]